MLTFSRLEAAREQPDLEPVAVGPLLDEVAAIVDPLAERKGIAFRVATSDGSEQLVTDARNLRQILLNLVGNAVKFTDQGEVSLTVTQEEEVAVFTVHDTGIGIDPANFPRFFEPFWQADSALTRTVGGTGLGLSIAHRFAEMLDGEIQVESRLGNGSTFRVRLPL